MIDFTNIDVINDPYPYLAELRKNGKPIWHEELQLFLAPNHRDANEVLRNKSLGRIFTPKEPLLEWDIFNYLHSDSILDCEPPKHTRLRSLVMKAFNKKRIESLRPNILSLAETLLDDIEAKNGTFDLIRDYAEPLPVKVIAALLGFPIKDEELLRPWSQAIVKMYEVNPSTQQKDEAKIAANEFAEYVHGLMLLRKATPADDLITELAHVEEAGEKLSSHELIATCVLLLNAGHEASVNGFGNGMVAAYQNHSQWELLQKSPEALAATAVEEFLRFDAPLQFFDRTATQDVEIGGVTLKAGQKIVSLLGSANRDGDVFTSPDHMDITRDPNPHIGFGAGIHFCLGAPLARLELNIALPAIFKRFPKLELEGSPIRRQTFALRGYEAVPARIS